MAQFSEDFSVDGDYVKSENGKKIKFNDPNFELRNTGINVEYENFKSNITAIYNFENQMVDTSLQGNDGTIDDKASNRAYTQNTIKKIGNSGLKILNSNIANPIASIYCPSVVITDATDDWTVLFWLRLDDVSTVQNIMFFGINTTKPSFSLTFENVNQLYLAAKDITGFGISKPIDLLTPIISGEWNQFILTNKKNPANALQKTYKLYKNSILQSTLINQNNPDFITGNVPDIYFGKSNYSSTFCVLDGYYDEICFVDGLELEQSDITEIYTRQLLNYYLDLPYLTNVDDLTATIEEFESATQTIIGTGTLGINVSIDSGVTWLYWDGANWSSTDGLGANYNTIATVNSNISFLDSSNNKLKWRRFFISDGTQNLEITNAVTGYDDNQAPNLVIGADKSTQDQYASFKPFSDTTFSDPEGGVLSFHYKIGSGSWIEILKGAFGTLQEAVQDEDISFDYADGVSQILTGRVTDDGAKTDEDNKTITVSKYSLTVNFTDQYGNVLINLKYKLVDGDWTEFDSPLELEFVYNASQIAIAIDKPGYENFYVYFTATADSTQDIQLQSETASPIGEIDIDIENDEIIIDIE